MGRVTTVDVARRDLCSDDVTRRQRKRRAVVGEHADSLECPRSGAEQLHDLTARRGLVGDVRGLAVETHVVDRLFHRAVRFARHDETVLGDADVQALAASVQCEVHVVRFVRGAVPDGDRTLELRDGIEESRKCRGPALAATVDESRDHLGIGGDGVGEPQAVSGLQVGMVVDITVQNGHRERTGVVVHFLTVDGMGVRLGDDSHTRPPRVPEHRRAGALGPECTAQKPVTGEGCTHVPRVVTEFADLGSGLVHEDERAAHLADAPVGEQRIGGTFRNCSGQVGVGLHERRRRHEHTDSCRVTAAHLHAVDRRQCLLDAEVPRECRL